MMRTMTDGLDLLPNLLGNVRPALPELRDPLPGGSDVVPTEGGGAPSAPVVVEPWASHSPTSNSVQVVAPHNEQALALLRAALPEPTDPAPEPLPVTWDGRPTDAALSRLRWETRTPGFDEEQAILLLDLVGNGMSMTKACEVVGVRRSVVLAWRRLVPAFDELMNDMEVALGAYQRDISVEEGDPAMVRARLAAASAFDRRIAKGDMEGGGAVAGIVVNVTRYSDGADHG